MSFTFKRHSRWPLALACLAVQSLCCMQFGHAQQSPQPIIHLIPTVRGCTPVPTANSPIAYNCASGVLSLQDTISGQVFALPSGSTSNFTAAPYTSNVGSVAPTWVQLPSTASLPLSGLAAIPLSNTTIKIRMLAQTAPAKAYTSLVSMAAPSGSTSASMFSIGQRGSSWTYGRFLDYVNSTTRGYWMTPWEPVDPFPAESGIFEDVYYTFTPDARLTIDMFVPYHQVATPATVNYVWQESVEDGGWPMKQLGDDINTSTDAQAFLPSGNLILGADHGAGQFSAFGFNDASGATTIPTASADKILSITVYSQPLVSVVYNNSKNSSVTNVSALRTDVETDFSAWGTADGKTQTTIYPCNSGEWMGIGGFAIGHTTIYTPCGGNTAAGQAVPLPPTSVTPLDAFLAHTPVPASPTSITNATFTANWAAPATVTPPSNYTLYVFDSNHNQVSATTANTLSSTVTGLQGNQTYTYYVKANYSGVTYDDNITAAQTVTTAAPLPAPTITTFGSTSRSLSVVWNDTNSYSDHNPDYTVTLTPTQGGGAPIVQNAGNTLSSTFTGLYSADAYSAVVSVADQGYTSLNSTAVSQTTVLSAPVLTGSSATTTGITLSWTDPNNAYYAGETYSYEVKVNGVLIISCPATGLSCSIAGLTPSRAYTLSVDVKSGSLTSPLASTTITTSAVQAPLNLSASNITPSSFTVTWNDPNSLGSTTPSYLVSYRPATGGILTNVTTSSPSISITGLTQSTPYIVSIVETVGGVGSASSSTLGVTTLGVGPVVGLAFDTYFKAPVASWSRPANEAHALTYNLSLLDYTANVTTTYTTTNTTYSLPQETVGHGYQLSVSASDATYGLTGPISVISHEGANLPTPANWNFCVNENDSCSAPQASWMLFGLTTSNIVIPAAANISTPCTDGQFRSDPDQHVAKSCFLHPMNSSNVFDYCATENGSCNNTDANGALVAFGSTVNNVFTYIVSYFPSGTFQCNAASFAGVDPTPHHVKTCSYLSYF